ncbi:hypothetical protein Tco_0695894 [Tanacetum coccineum]
MEILIEPTSNKLMVEHAKFDESNANVLERFYTSAGNPVKEILLKLNLLDHRILKDGGEVDRPELVQELLMKNPQIKERLKLCLYHQKSYADKRRKPLEFSVGDYVLLKVSPWKGVKCLADPTLQVPLDEIRVDAKLNFMEEPMEILEREFKKFKRSWIAIVKVLGIRTGPIIHMGT